MNQVLQETHRGVSEQQPQHQGGVVYTPEADILETSGSYVVDVYMPGVTDKSAEATLENDVLTIRGQVDLTPRENVRLMHQEYRVGDYRRVFTLTDDIDRDHVSATVRDGVLHLVLPKAESSKAKRIAIKAA
jgi:HSP20 family molecular chaperone IbpA